MASCTTAAPAPPDYLRIIVEPLASLHGQIRGHGLCATDDVVGLAGGSVSGDNLSLQRGSRVLGSSVLTFLGRLCGFVAAQDTIAKKCWRRDEYQNLRRITLVGSIAKALEAVKVKKATLTHDSKSSSDTKSSGAHLPAPAVRWVCAMSLVERAIP